MTFFVSDTRKKNHFIFSKIVFQFGISISPANPLKRTRENQHQTFLLFAFSTKANSPYIRESVQNDLDIHIFSFFKV